MLSSLPVRVAVRVGVRFRGARSRIMRMSLGRSGCPWGYSLKLGDEVVEDLRDGVAFETPLSGAPEIRSAW